jgi:hypothetical protein
MWHPTAASRPTSARVFADVKDLRAGRTTAIAEETGGEEDEEERSGGGGGGGSGRREGKVAKREAAEEQRQRAAAAEEQGRREATATAAAEEQRRRAAAAQQESEACAAADQWQANEKQKARDAEMAATLEREERAKLEAREAEKQEAPSQKANQKAAGKAAGYWWLPMLLALVLGVWTAGEKGFSAHDGTVGGTELAVGQEGQVVSWSEPFDRDRIAVEFNGRRGNVLNSQISASAQTAEQPVLKIKFPAVLVCAGLRILPAPACVLVSVYTPVTVYNFPFLFLNALKCNICVAVLLF